MPVPALIRWARPGIDQAVVPLRVLVHQLSAQHPGDDLHVPVRVRLEAAARRHDVVVVDQQQTEVGVARVVVLAERERVLGVQPAEVGGEPVAGPAYVDRGCQQCHGIHPSEPCCYADTVAERNHSRRARGVFRISACRPAQASRLVDRPGVDHPLGRHAALLGPLAAVGLPVQLPGRVGVGVDREQAAGLDREPQQPPGRVQPLRPGVDLDGDAEPLAGREHQLGVERRLAPGAPAPGRPAGRCSGPGRRCAGWRRR